MFRPYSHCLIRSVENSPNTFHNSFGLSKSRFCFILTIHGSKQKETNADVVSGTRYHVDGGSSGWNFKRRLVSQGANFISHFFLGVATQCTDLTGSFRLYRTDVLRDLMESVITKGYVFQMEIISRACLARCKIAEVPIIFVDRIFGESKLGAGEIKSYLTGLWKLMITL